MPRGGTSYGCGNGTSPLGKVDKDLGCLAKFGLESHHGFGAGTADGGEEDADGGDGEGDALVGWGEEVGAEVGYGGVVGGGWWRRHGAFFFGGAEFMGMHFTHRV